MFQGVVVVGKPVAMAVGKLMLEELSVKGNAGQKPQGITYDGEKLNLTDRLGEDEVTAKWAISDDSKINNGLYKLTYYMQTGAQNKETKRVELEFHVGKIAKLDDKGDLVKPEDLEVKEGNIAIFAKLFNENDKTPSKTTYYKYKAPYGKDDRINVGEKETYITNITLAPDAKLIEKEAAVGIGNLGQVKMYYRDNQLFVSTTGINKGIIAPFTLTYEEDYGNPAGQVDGSSAFNAYKGLETFNVLPTHLITSSSAIGFVSQDTIRQNNGEKAGSKPGIVVKFAKPRVLGADGKFINIDEAPKNHTDGDKFTSATLLLTEELGDGEQVDRGLKVSFDLKDGGEINILGGQTHDEKKQGTVISNGDYFELYFSKDKEEFGQVQQWDKLEAGMLIGAEMAFSGNYFNTNPANPEVKERTSKPDNLGYTYVEYRAVRSGVNQISFHIKPYNIQGGVTYQLIRKGLDGKDAVVDERNYKSKPEVEAIVLNSYKSTGENEYMIRMITTEKKAEFDSQRLIYNADDEPIPPPVTEITNIDNVYVIPNDDINSNPDHNAQTKPEAVGMDIEWRAPADADLKELLDGGKNELYYELYMSTEANKDYETIKVFKVYYDTTDNLIKVRLYGGSGGSIEGIYKSGVNGAPGTFTVRDVILKEKDYHNPPTDAWEQISMPEGYMDKDVYPAGTYAKQEDVDAKYGQIEDKVGPSYTIPDTFYFTMKPVYQKDGAEKLGAGTSSNPKSLTLDAVHEIIPTPGGLAYKDTSTEDIFAAEIAFDYVDLRDYIKNMLDPAGIVLTKPKTPTTALTEEERNRRTYEIYLYQYNPLEESAVPDFDNPEDVRTVESGKDDKGIAQVMLDQEDKEHLRQKGNVIKIEYEDWHNKAVTSGDKIKVNIQGLEPNMPYYVQVRVKLDLWKKEMVAGSTTQEFTYEQINDPRYSILSKVLSFTTSTKPLPPTPDEQTPPAPIKFWEKEKPSETSVLLGWIPPELSANAAGDIYYEIVRSTSQEMDKAHQTKDMTLEQIIKEDSKNQYIDYKSFHTKNPYIYGYEGGVYSGQDYEAGWKELKDKQDSSKFELVDTDLLPNTIYYYYIRTVNEIANEKVHSNWIMVPVTTMPLQAPIKLMLEPESNYKYDPQREAVISFWAPIPKNGKVPTEYDFEVAIKGEKDNTYMTANEGGGYKATLVKEESIGDETYRKFVYKITGLKHGSRYDIKVRTLDHTKATAQPVKSAYCDKIIIRTEYSEDDQDKENAFDKYLEKYDKEAEKLKKNDYWEVEGGSRQGIYKYRQSYLDSEIGATDTYTLMSEDGQKHVYYYLPSSTFERARKENTMLTFQVDDYVVYMRPGMLYKNDGIQRAEEKLKEGRIEDYYIGVEFALGGISGKVNGSKTISPELLIDMEVIYLEQEDALIEDEIMDELLGRIATGRNEVIKRLEREVVDDYIDEEKLDSIIKDEIDYVKKKHKEDVKDIMEDVVDDDKMIGEIQKPMLIVGLLDADRAEAYYAGKGWEAVYTFSTMGGFGFDAKQLGSYVFAGKNNAGNVIPEVPGGSDLVTKYTLTDFFSLTESGMNSYVTKEALYGSVARVMGARRGTDYTQYLKDRGIKLIAPNNIYQPIRTDEAIYTVMQAYEKIYYKSVDSIYIANKQSVQNIGAFQPQYRQYVYAAVQLGVVSPKNNKVLPSEPMTTRDVIKMLTVIMPK